jgi:hypothetical protein
MSIEQIYLAMERNRRSHDQQIARIRLSFRHSPELQPRLADAWLDAMQLHYRLLWDYLQLREIALTFNHGSRLRLKTEQLRAPRRPDELPESLSRYVTTAQHAERLI